MLKCYNYKNRDLRMILIPLTDNVLLNKSIFVGPYCARNGLDVAALKSEDLVPLERESFTNGLILDLWKQRDSVNQMLQWIPALTPPELQRYLSGVTAQNLNKSCNDLMKKVQKPGKNKKKEELELLKQTPTPKLKTIAELKNENRGLKRSVSKMLSFSERLLDENDALIDDQAALEYEYFSTVNHMAQIANEKRDKIKFTCDLVPILL